MAITATTIRDTVYRCIRENYSNLRAKELVGKCTEEEWTTLKKLKVMFNLSIWLDLTETELKKIFCFISECKHIK